MKKAHKAIPEPIRRQIRLRMFSGVVIGIIFMIAWITTGQFQVCSMLLFLAILILVNGSLMLYHCSKGRFLHLFGKCVDMERTGIFGRTKRIHVETENTIVSIPMHRNLNQLHIGDTVHIYLSEKTPLMIYNDMYVINHLYAVKAERKKDE